jgi:hypothetical protein
MSVQPWFGGRLRRLLFAGGGLSSMIAVYLHGKYHERRTPGSYAVA